MSDQADNESREINERLEPMEKMLEELDYQLKVNNDANQKRATELNAKIEKLRKEIEATKRAR